jgi:hypothetical protein
MDLRQKHSAVSIRLSANHLGSLRLTINSWKEDQGEKFKERTEIIATLVVNTSC